MPSTIPATDLPVVIQGGMGVAVSSWQLARTVASHGGLGVVSGVGPDLLVSRMLQDGDPGGHVRRALADYPDQGFVAQTLTRYFRPDGLEPGTGYRPVPKLDLNQKLDALRLSTLGVYTQVWLAKEGHDGPIGLNLLEKVQLYSPPALLGAMIAGVDVVLVGAGVPAHLPRLLDGLANLQPITLPIDVIGARSGDRYEVTLDPRTVVPGLTALHRPVFLAIISAHVLAAYLARDPATRPDGFIIEGPTAGGHNAPPRRPEVDEHGETVFGPRDVVDLAKVAAVGLPYWLAGGFSTPEKLRQALAAGAHGVQIGTAFALSRESGLLPSLKQKLIEGVRRVSLHVRTDPLASPTGFPFKIAEVDGTTSGPEVYDARGRICDLSYLRKPYRRDDDTIGYRCPAEPVDAFVKKGGSADDTVGRMCLCNGLTASAGYPQHRPDGSVEPPTLTVGQDLEAPRRLLQDHPDGYSAVDVLRWLKGA